MGRHFSHTSSEGYCVLRQPSGNKGGTICSRASERERRFGVPFQSVRRTRSHRMKFCVQRGLGALPSTSKRRGKSRRDFLLCGPVCINTGIACLFSPKLKRTSERIVKFHSLAQFISNISDNSVSSFTVSWV